MASFNTSQSTQQSGLLQVSQLAMQHMEDMFSWAQQQFANTSAITDQVVNDAMGLYGQLSGIGNSLMGMYDQYFQPEYSQLVNDANTYSSAARIQQAMGAAESDVSQSFGAQRQAALADLQSYGVDPSSGRYAALDNAERTQQAAAMAGAGFQAEQATEATGRALRSEALQLGSVMPSQATGAYNAAEGAATAAENAKLANVASGTRSMEAPAAYGQVAQQYRTGQSKSAGGGTDAGGGNRSGGGGSSGGTSAAPRFGTGFGPQSGSPDQLDIQGNPAGAGVGANGSGGYRGPAGGGSFTGDNIQSTGYQQGNPGDEVSRPPDQSYDPGLTDYSSGYAGPDQGASLGVGSAPANTFTGGGGNVDNNTGLGDVVPTGGDTFYGGDGGDFKEGGMVPYGASPSHGRVTDDVAAHMHGTDEPIRLNAGEFIIPRHTVRWKGEKFFQDLIRQSKEQRGAAGAKPSMKPALPAHRRAFAGGGPTRMAPMTEFAGVAGLGWGSQFGGPQTADTMGAGLPTADSFQHHTADDFHFKTADDMNWGNGNGQF